MKLNTTLLLLCLLFSYSGFAQHLDGNYDEWGKVSKEELEMKECSFEKNADAIMLLDLGKRYFQKDISFNMAGKFLITSAYYRRIKILTEKGTSRADCKLPFSLTRSDEITGLKACCYNLENGEIKKIELKKEDIHTNKLSEYSAELSFSIPGVKKGSVIELYYMQTRRITTTLPRWSFDSDIPTVKSSLQICFLDAVDYYVQKNILTKNFTETSTPCKTGVYIQAREEVTAAEVSGTIVTYTAQNLAAVKPEKFVNSMRNYTNWVAFQLRRLNPPLVEDPGIISSFKKLNEFLYNDLYFSGNLESEPLSKKLWEPLISDSMSDEKKATIIFDFIRSNISANNFYGLETQNSNNRVWKNKIGSRTEINLLLINTLRKAGITANPMLVGTREAGQLNTLYPMIEQYQEVVALVELANGRKVVLDAGEKFLPFGITKFELLNTTGLVLKSKGDSYWCNIRDKCADISTIVINGQLDETGKISGEINIAYYNYTANEYKELKQTNHENTISEYLKKDIPTATIESVSDSVYSEGAKFTQKVKFSMQTMADNDGNIYISIPAIYGDPDNPFVNKERTCDVDFGYIQKENIVMNLTVPTDYEVDSMVRTTKLMTPDSSISFTYQSGKEGNTIMLVQKLQYANSFYRKEDYPSFYEFHQKYYDMRQKPVILKKKA